MCAKTVEVEIDPNRVRSNEIAEIVGDFSKIRNETGWSPAIPLEKTLRDLLDYWRQKTKESSSINI